MVPFCHFSQCAKLLKKFQGRKSQFVISVKKEKPKQVVINKRKGKVTPPPKKTKTNKQTSRDS